MHQNSLTSLLCFIPNKGDFAEHTATHECKKNIVASILYHPHSGQGTARRVNTA